MKKSRIYVATIMLGALLAYSGTSQASARFGLKSLKGIYGFSASGTTGFGTVLTAAAGLNSFDGAGRCDISARANFGGNVESLTTDECSYQVNRDGTGSITVTFNEPPFGPFRSDFVIVDNGKEVHFVLSDSIPAGTVASGVATRQSPGERD